MDANRDFYFMEMNTRIQVEHTITEEVIDYDLIKEQIKLAAGEKSVAETTSPSCTASSAASTQKTPTAIGLLARENHRLPRPRWAWRPCRHPCVRGIHDPPHYDSMISKLIVVAQSREEAITKMQRALDEYIIEGVKTTIPFHQRLMKNQRFRDGDFTTKFLEEETSDSRLAGQACSFQDLRMRCSVAVVLSPGTRGTAPHASPFSHFGAAHHVMGVVGLRQVGS